MMSMINHKKKLITLFFGISVLACVFLTLAGCGAGEKNRGKGEAFDKSRNGGKEIYVYYLNRDETAIDGEVFEGIADAGNLLVALETDPDDLLLKKTLGAEVKLSTWQLAEGQLILDFEADYKNLSRTSEVLFRASLVQTLCQAPEVDSVAILVDGASITDTAGIPIEGMKPDNFVDIGKGDKQANDRTELVLYFANAEGTALVSEKRTVVYSTNVSIEKIIVEQLIQGPEKKGNRATLSPDRIVKSVSVKEGICYVDLTTPMLDLTGAVNEEVSVYSIVDSLTELPGINKVQISIDGDSDRTFRGTMELGKIYERNTDIIVK